MGQNYDKYTKKSSPGNKSSKSQLAALTSGIKAQGRIGIEISTFNVRLLELKHKDRAF